MVNGPDCPLPLEYRASVCGCQADKHGNSRDDRLMPGEHASVYFVVRVLGRARLVPCAVGLMVMGGAIIWLWEREDVTEDVPHRIMPPRRRAEDEQRQVWCRRDSETELSRDQTL